MSVIVKGLDEPERCDLCPFFRTYRYSPNVWCNGCNKILVRLNDPMEVVDLEVEVPNWCPIRQLPECSAERWIPVTERLPDQSDVFLVTLDDKYGPITYVALWQDGKWTSADDIFLLGDTEITAWMPRPRPWEGNK